jgi:lipoate-protein ligase A
MQSTFRLIMDSTRQGALNMGIDEAVLEGVIAGTSQPTLRLYGWQPPTLTIGYFQSIKEEADLEACRRLGVDCIRRTTGGGSVLHEFEVTYSIVAPIGFSGIPEPILDSYRYICQGIIRGVHELGVEAQFVPLNDIVAKGRKISGNAQTRRKGIILQHGTILLDVDVEKMFTVLKVPSEKMKDKLIQDVKQRVVGLRELIGTNLTFEDAANALSKGFEQALGCDLVIGAVSPDEMERAEVLAQEKYANPVWNLQR